MCMRVQKESVTRIACSSMLKMNGTPEGLTGDKHSE